MSVKRIRWYSIFNLAVLIRYGQGQKYRMMWRADKRSRVLITDNWTALQKAPTATWLAFVLTSKGTWLDRREHTTSIPQLIWCKRANPGYGLILVVLACRLGIGFKTVQGCRLYRDMEYVIERYHLHSCIELVALNGILWSCPTDRSISTISFWGISSITLQIVYVTHMWHKDIGLHQDLRALTPAF